jgi:hypothetical protein
MIIRNAGKLAAHNVRVPHNGKLAAANIHVSVLPQNHYEVRSLPTGGEELLFPILPPKETLTISYLYFPPVQWNQIHQQCSQTKARRVCCACCRRRNIHAGRWHFCGRWSP